VGLSDAPNYMLGVLTNHKSVRNMYLYGAALLATLRIVLASTGAGISIVEGSYAATVDYSTMAIETFIPIFICLERGLASFGEMIEVVVLNIGIGTVVSGVKYGLAT